MPCRRRSIEKPALVLALLLWALIGTYLALLPDPPGGIFGSDGRHMLVAAILTFGIGVYAPSLPERPRPHTGRGQNTPTTHRRGVLPAAGCRGRHILRSRPFH